MPLENKTGHTPTSRVYPILYRKIIKKILVIEVAVTDEGRRAWRSIFGAIILMGALFVLVGMNVSPDVQGQFNQVFAIYLLAALMLVSAIFIYEWLYVLTYYYDVGETFLRIRKGVLIRREVSIPYGQIQNIEVDQDPMDHLLGLYDLHIATAAEKYILDPHIDGLSYRSCEKLREMIYKEIEEAHRPNVVSQTVTPVAANAPGA
jgi:membrane protein YdbS with pleckstrin-like domain